MQKQRLCKNVVLFSRFIPSSFTTFLFISVVSFCCLSVLTILTQTQTKICSHVCFFKVTANYAPNNCTDTHQSELQGLHIYQWVHHSKRKSLPRNNQGKIILLSISHSERLKFCLTLRRVMFGKISGYRAVQDSTLELTFMREVQKQVKLAIFIFFTSL